MSVGFLGMRPAVALRLQFIECMLANYGTINRAVLEDYFGLSTPQVSLDLAMYRELAPGNLEYDATAKTYRRGENFTRVWP